MKQRIADLVSPRPMVVLTLIFILGILIENWLQLGLWGYLFFIPIIAGIAHFVESTFYKILLLFLLLLVGGARQSAHQSQSLQSLSRHPTHPDSVYQVSAIVVEVGETRRGTPKYTLAPYWIDEADIDQGKIILYSKDLDSIPEIGDTLNAMMTVFQPRGKRNPNEFDYRGFLAANGVYREAFIQDPESVVLRGSQQIHLSKLLFALKQNINSYLHEYLTPKTAGIISALLLGERGEVDEETRANFANTGVIHVLAVSGLHVGYVTLILMTLVGLVRLPHNFQIILVAIGLGFYVMLTGGAASVMRASIMASLILIATILERKSDIFNILATAAFIILLIDPSQVFGIGFQLSFSAVLSIVLLFPVFKSYVPEIGMKNHPILKKLILNVTDLFLVSLAAQLGTLAITIYYFHKIPIISLLANLLVVPLIGLIVATGMCILLLGSFIPLFANCWAAFLETIISFMLSFVAYCAGFDWAYLSTRWIDGFEVLLLLGAIFSMAGLKPKRLMKVWIILLLIWIELSVWKGLLSPKNLEVTMLDVGQGDAVVVHKPQGRTMVIDAGLKFGGKDMGKDVIIPYLQQRNWNAIDLLVLTHPHNDHIGGAQYLLENLPVKRVLMQDVDYDSYTYTSLLALLDSLRIPIQSAFTGRVDSSMAPAYLRVTGPKLFDDSSQPPNINDVSIVFQLFYGETSMLFTGDAEHHVEEDQLHLGHLLHSDILKAPHHGSKTSSSVAYLDLVRPSIGLMSMGTGNKFKHPAPITLQHYEQRDIGVHRTDLEGAIHYVSDGKRWTYVDWREDSGR